MYIFPNMIEMGLKEGKTWPSHDHKQIASTIGLCNPNVTTMDTLQAVVTAVCAVPQERIRRVSYKELVDEFDLPDVQIYL